MSKRFLVVGAGINGLCIADELAAAGHEVVVAERNLSVGGMSQTYTYNGFTFDSGPHWVFINSERMRIWLKDLLGDVIYEKEMRPGVFFLNKYYKWPLTLEVILKLPPSVMVKAFADMVKIMFSRPKEKAKNYEQLMLNKFGKTLYDLDFEPYTSKFTKTPLENLHIDWSKIGVNRSVDEKPALDSIFTVIAKTLSPKKKTYGGYLDEGIIGISRALTERIEKNGGKILLNTVVTKAELKDNKLCDIVLNDDMPQQYDHIVWTGRTNDIAQLILGKRFKLDYLTNVLFHISIKGTQYPPYQWLYYVGKDIIFNRLYNTVEFSKKHAPDNCFGYCAEVTCRSGEDLESNPEKYLQTVIDDLVKTHAITDKQSILDVNIQVKKDAYPLYDLNYRAQLKACVEELYSNCSNISLTGRCGLFWYNNIDHTLDNAFAEVEAVLKGTRTDVSLKSE